MRKNKYIEAFKKNNDEEYNDYIHYLVEAKRLAKKFFSDTTVDDKGVVRWNSNNNVPPFEILVFWSYLNYDFDFINSENVRKKQEDKAIKKYREQMKNYQPSQEELFEMRATHGKDTTVVDIITGKEIKI
ncbi:MAG: hypothetical protein ACOC2W_00660 [bacterium]